jgi:DNA-binding response OmpR family regulator
LTPVLFMSGHSQDVLGPRGALDRDAPLIQKPFAAQELLKAIRALLPARPA